MAEGGMRDGEIKDERCGPGGKEVGRGGIEKRVLYSEASTLL